jgi:Mg2+-importing ATPase
MGISSDNVDAERLEKPQKWNDELIRDFMIVFGLQSSIFDFLTFGTLLFFFKTGTDLFRTGWFLESVITEIVVLLVIRTRRPTLKSNPGRYLMIASCITAIVVIALPYMPFADSLGIVPIPLPVFAGMIGIAVLYGLATDMTKKAFFKRSGHTA